MPSNWKRMLRAGAFVAFGDGAAKRRRHWPGRNGIRIRRHAAAGCFLGPVIVSLSRRRQIEAAKALGRMGRLSRAVAAPGSAVPVRANGPAASQRQLRTTVQESSRSIRTCSAHELHPNPSQEEASSEAPVAGSPPGRE